MTLADRFWPKVNKNGPIPDLCPELGVCWDWTASRNKTSGYGVVWSGEKSSAPMLYAHRVAYELEVGPIPDGLTLDHLCNRRQCVNPAHLDPCTTQVNSHRGKLRRTTCAAGHPKDGNTYTPPKGPDRCRVCNTERARERRAHAVPR